MRKPLFVAPVAVVAFAVVVSAAVGGFVDFGIAVGGDGEGRVTAVVAAAGVEASANSEDGLERAAAVAAACAAAMMACDVVSCTPAAELKSFAMDRKDAGNPAVVAMCAAA